MLPNKFNFITLNKEYTCTMPMLAGEKAHISWQADLNGDAGYTAYSTESVARHVSEGRWKIVAEKENTYVMQLISKSNQAPLVFLDVALSCAIATDTEIDANVGGTVVRVYPESFLQDLYEKYKLITTK